MDEIDRAIMTRLVQHGREPYADIARTVGLSLSATKRRVDRLVASGAIRGFSAVVDPAQLGWALSASMEVFTHRTVPLDQMRRDLAAIPEIQAASTVSGRADALLRVVASDSRHLEHVVQSVRSLDYVDQTNTVLILSDLLLRGDAIR